MCALAYIRTVVRANHISVVHMHRVTLMTFITNGLAKTANLFTLSLHGLSMFPNCRYDFESD